MIEQAGTEGKLASRCQGEVALPEGGEGVGRVLRTLRGLSESSRSNGMSHTRRSTSPPPLAN